MTEMTWWKEVEAIIEEKSLLKHFFYQAWNKGDLAREDLAYYAQQYYQQESRFPRYLSAVHSNCPELGIRQILLENLNHEEAGQENHPELWLKFAEAVGASRESVKNAAMNDQTQSCVSTFGALSRSERWPIGLAALYAYEAQQPTVAKTKIDGLKNLYGVASKEATKFFAVHQEMDVWHSETEKQILQAQGDQEPWLREEIKTSVARACDALNVLLDGVCQARGISCEGISSRALRARDDDTGP